MSERGMTDRELAAMILYGLTWVAGGCALIWFVRFAIGAL
jgi:hypothetical protein